MAQWVKASGKTIPEGAVRGGYEKDGKSLFIVRARMADGYMTPGKIGHHLPGAHFPYGGKEVILEEYEVLVHSSSSEGYYDWQPGKDGQVPAGAVATDGSIMYIGRYKHDGGLHPGKVFTDHKVCYISYAGKEIHSNHYESLCKVK